MKLGNLVKDHWIDGDGDGTVLTSAVSGSPVASITSKGLDFADMLQHARTVGGSNLRRYTFHERALMLKALAQCLMEHKVELYELSTQTGATRQDSWIDIDGGISTLFVFSSKGRREMPNSHVYLDGPRKLCRGPVLSSASIFVHQSSASLFTSMRSTSPAGACSKSWHLPCLPACRLSSSRPQVRPT